ncbi:Zinc/iron permease, partial [Gonapodya prolifera JEL478]
IADPCAPDFSEDRERSLHIAAIFIQIAISLSGTLIPIILQRYNLAGKFTDFVFDGIRNFGTGIILTTGTIHMLLPAYTLLTSPCLPPKWSTDYTAFTGVFALVGMLLTQVHPDDRVGVSTSDQIVLVFCVSVSTFPTPVKSFSYNHTDHVSEHGHAHEHAHDHEEHLERGYRDGASDLTLPSNHAHTNGPPSSSPHSSPHTHTHTHTHTRTDSSPALPFVPKDQPHTHPFHEEDDGHGHLRDALFAGGDVAGRLRKKQVTVYLLETGIASHSFFVGLVLGTSRGAELRALMFALAFHQFFEGMALSATLLDAKFTSRAPAIIMVCLYTIIKPLGVAVGIALNEAYNPNSPAALLTQGILDAVSAGVLIYDSLVNLLHVNITSNAKFHASPVWKKTVTFALLYAGVAVMSTIGKFA